MEGRGDKERGNEKKGDKERTREETRTLQSEGLVLLLLVNIP